MDYINIQELLIKGIQKLNQNNIEDSALIARILLSSILNCRKEDLVIKYKDKVCKDIQNKFLEGIEKISKGYPLQYLSKNKEFMCMSFYVDENVLVPRSDTEILAEEVIKICKQYEKKDILELCTGSGAIAIALKKYLDKVNIMATDISFEALNIAKKNAKLLLEKDDIKFIQSNMFDNIEGQFDIIVSNPPYIKTEEIKEYNLKYEPKLALDGGQDGLDFYRIIIKDGYKYLKKDGYILLEIGYDQKEEIMSIVKKIGKYKEAHCVKDLSGNDRVIIIN